MRIHQSIRVAATVIVAAWVLAGGPPVAAEPYPDRPIQLIIPFAPGDTDQMLRPFTERMGEFLGRPVVLNYKPGAAGGLGAGMVATSKPDGYTLVGSSPGSLVIVPLANKEMKYGTDSFAPIAALVEGGLMLVVPAGSPYQSIKDVVEQAKRAPGTITFSSSGVMGITHLLAEIFSQAAGIKLNHIPHQGSGPAITALLGGHVDMASTAIAPAQGHIQAGKLRALAAFSDKRLKAYPDVPTLKEMGYDVGSPTLYGIVAPRGTPDDVIAALHGAARKVSEKYGDQIGASLSLIGAEVKLLGPREYADYLDNQARLFGRGIRSLN
ncbi:MAG: tripartite tricarboxylate transporter substrate binding protein [Burkholderiaceae bacterium]